MQSYKLCEVSENFDSLRAPLSENERCKRRGLFRYYGAQEIIDYIDDYIFDGEYILVAEDGNNLLSGNKPLCTLVDGKFWVNNHAHIIRGNEKANTKYLYYLLNSINIRGYVTGSAQPKLNQANLNKIKIKLPELNIQNAIVNKIEVFDKKIRNNIDVQNNIKQYIQLLYHKWFIDFNFPNEDGKDYKNSSGNMEDYNGKIIPQGWNRTLLKEFIEDVITGDWGEDIKAEGLTEILCIRGADIPEWNIGKTSKTPTRFIDLQKRAKKELKNGDIMIEASGGSPVQSTGRTIFITESILKSLDKPVFCSNFSKIIRPKSFEYGIYLNEILINLYNRGVFFHYEGKTTGIKNLLIQRLVEKFNVINPPIETIEKFSNEVIVLYDKINVLGKENEYLEQTRDLLIKKLIK